MPLPTPQRVDPISQNNWQLGMITSVPPEEIPIGGAQLINNLEFDLESNLATRNGVSLFLTLTGETGRITSMFRAEYSDGTVWILITVGSKLYRCTESGGSLTNITGALTFPSNTRWQWVMFGDFAIGVNGATSGTNPVKVNAAGTASLLANAPFAKYVDVWNNRLWLVRSATTEKNSVYGSAINLPEDWTVDDDAGAIQLGIDPNDGDFITGIKAFKGSMYVRKKNKINIIYPIGTPATIPNNLKVDIYTDQVGTLSGYSIQNVIDDQLAINDAGILSIVLAPLGELKGAIVSRNIGELSKLKKTSSAMSEVVATVFDDMNQYLISIPSTLSTSGFNEAWVLDYQKIGERDEKGFPIVRWIRFDGKLAGTAYSERLDQTYKTYLIAEYPDGTNDVKIYQYQPTNPVRSFSDGGSAYNQILKTKSFSSSSPLLRNLWYAFGSLLKLVSANLTLKVNWYWDNEPASSGNYDFPFIFDTSALAIYGSAIYGTAIYGSASAAEREESIWRRFKKNSKGRKRRTVALEFIVATVDEGFIIKYIQLDHTKLNKKRARTA